MTSGRADWTALTAFLAARPPDEGSVTLSWAELGSIVGGVPDSAVRHHPQWWHGDRSHVRAWRAAGYAAFEVQPGRSVTFRRAGAANPVTQSPGRRRENRATPPDALLELQEIDPRNALLVIPCSKTKRPGGSASSQRATSWPSALATARERNRAAAGLDERQLMPAWRRYSGHFYNAADAVLGDAMSSDASLIILSGGYGLVHANEPIGNYNMEMRLARWPAGLLEGLLAAEAKQRNPSAVVAFAAASTDYAKLIRRAPWRDTGAGAFLVTIQGVGGGASGEVPRRLGRAFTCFWQQQPADQYPMGTTVQRLA